MSEIEMLQTILTKVTGMEADISEIKQRVTKIEVTQEQETSKNIKLLVESQMETREEMKRLRDVADRVEDIQITVNAMEAVTKQSCTDIKQLRAVK